MTTFQLMRRTFALLALVIGISACGSSPTQPKPEPVLLKADFSIQASNGLKYGYTDASVSPADDPIVEWMWNFGDGATSAERNPAHIYAEGTYEVSLTVKTSSGNTQSKVATATPKPLSKSLAAFHGFTPLEPGEGDKTGKCVIVDKPNAILKVEFTVNPGGSMVVYAYKEPPLGCPGGNCTHSIGAFQVQGKTVVATWDVVPSTNEYCIHALNKSNVPQSVSGPVTLIWPYE